MVKRFSLFLLLLFVIMTSVCAQQIQGVVTDAVTGEPIPYLTVYYEGKGVGAITDIDGRYVVEKHPEWKELVFSSVGYEVRIVPIVEKTRTLNVKLKPLDHTLDEVVVRPKREKYSRKNNPAVELMKKVVASKALDNLKQKDYYSFNTYQKLTFAVNNITADSLKESKIFQKFPKNNSYQFCP